jgi:hypothetical protein
MDDSLAFPDRIHAVTTPTRSQALYVAGRYEPSAGLIRAVGWAAGECSPIRCRIYITGLLGTIGD